MIWTAARGIRRLRTMASVRISLRRAFCLVRAHLNLTPYIKIFYTPFAHSPLHTVIRPTRGERRRLVGLETTTRPALHALLAALCRPAGRYAWPLECVFLVGFSQGADAAVDAALHLADSAEIAAAVADAGAKQAAAARHSSEKATASVTAAPFAPGSDADQRATSMPHPDMLAALAQASGSATSASVSASASAPTGEPSRPATKGRLRLGGLVALSGSVLRECAWQAASPSRA